MGEVVLTREAILGVLVDSQEYDAYQFRIAKRVMDNAILIFEFSQKSDNELRTSEYTPPKYVSSFRLDRRKAALSYDVINDDPGWYLVEFGGTTDGHPTVPAYRPLGRGLDQTMAEGVV